MIKHEPVYSASKYAVMCFTQSTRRQVNKHGIRVAQVSPGPVNSALLADWPADRLQAALDDGAVIEPSEIADAVMFILSRARTVTIHDVACHGQSGSQAPGSSSASRCCTERVGR